MKFCTGQQDTLTRPVGCLSWSFENIDHVAMNCTVFLLFLGKLSKKNKKKGGKKKEKEADPEEEVGVVKKFNS